MAQQTNIGRTTRAAVVALALWLAAPAVAPADDAVPADPQPRWWKGNTHTHTLWSDGDDFPEMVAEWYRTRGYHFLQLSDHNVLSQGQKWMKMGDLVRKGGGKDAIEKYRARFGPDWIETRGAGDQQEVRLKPLNEFRPLVEERGKFIMIQGTEITQAVDKPDAPPGSAKKADKLPVHMNATNALEAIKVPQAKTVLEAMQNAVAAVEDQEKRTGQPMIIHLNHPNFGWGVTAEDLAQVFGERFFEVYNGHPAVHQLGDDKHESVERIWDIVNTIRLTQLHARPLMGIGVDDSHAYHVMGMNRSGPGRGWIQVRARRLTPESIVNAMKAGDFYASSGVALKDVRFENGQIKIEIDAQAGEHYTTRFVGTPVEHELMSGAKYSPQVGMTFAEVKGTSPSYKLTGKELYVRAVITSDAKPDQPSWAEQTKQAWTQPVTLQPDPTTQPTTPAAAAAR
jgi:hypothetical protein